MWNKVKSFLFKNTSTKQTVAKNTIWLTISNFGGRLLKAIVIIYGARILGTDSWGLFSYAVTLSGFLALLLDPGINSILIRNAARASEEERRTLLATTFIMKIVLVIVGGALIIFIAPYFSTLPGAKVLLPLVAIILAGDTMREFFSSHIRGIEKMEWETGIFLLTNAAIVAFGFWFLWISPTVLSFTWAYVVGTALGAVAGAYVLRDYLKNTFSAFSSKLVLPIIRSAWPFAVATALGLLLTNTDILIISWMKTASDVGIYSAAIRIIQVLYIVPMIVQYSTLPALARLARTDNAGFRAALERVLSLIFLVAIPLALGGAILGTELMRFVFGAAYAPGGPSFSILSLTLIVDFAGGVVSAAIFAYEKQKGLIGSAAIGGISNVIFDLLLIPRFGITGSAVATLIAQTACNSYLWYMMDKINPFSVMPYLKKIVGASLGMAAMAYILLITHMPVAINIVVSTACYFILLAWLREPLLKELKKIIFHGMNPLATAKA